MRILGVALAFILADVAARAADEFPSWAYTVATVTNPPGSPPKSGKEVRRVPGSTASFTFDEIDGKTGIAVDWFPADHPVMPDIVSKVRTAEWIACAFCHHPDGIGYPQNASLTGLSVGYIRQQVRNFRDGLRASSAPQRPQQLHMTAVAHAVSEDEVERAAAYFAQIPPVTVSTVVESATAASPKGETEPLVRRIVEIASEPERIRSHDPRVPFTAYVPEGSLQRGAELVTTGAGLTIACITCHGPELQGLGDVPRLAGRSPSYLMRQLYDFKQGTRAGSAALLMQPTVVNLSVDDMLAIVAYLASLDPKGRMPIPLAK